MRPNPHSSACAQVPPLLGNERGVALIAVILVISLLAIFMVEFAYNSRIKLRMTDNSLKQLKAYMIARGGVDAAADLLLFDAKQGTAADFYAAAPGLTDMIDPSEFGELEEIWSWAAQGIPLTYPVGEGTLVIQISDECGKINLNTVEDPKKHQLAFRLFETLIATSPELEHPITAEEVVDSIREWIDGDQGLERDSVGVEGNYYEGLDPPYSAKDGRMDSVSELRMVSGISSRFYRYLLDAAGADGRNADALASPLITVFPQHGSAGEVNVNTAPALVIEALHPNFTPSLVEEIIEYRRENPFQNIGEFYGQFADAQTKTELYGLVTVKSDTFSVASTGVLGNIAVTVRAVLQRETKKNQVRILYWRVEG